MFDFFLTIWNTFLFQPLFNVLIWIYNNMTNQNLGWAVVFLTVALRIVLLPLYIVQVRNEKRNQELHEEVKKLAGHYKNDAVLKKQEIRRILKEKKVSPWAKFLSLGIQGLVLVLLYQVFLKGITGDKILKTLYTSVDFPGTINTIFYGFDLGHRHDVIWGGAVAVFLFVENYLDVRKTRKNFTNADLSYFVFFPLAVYFLLWILPMVKSLFVLVSMIISVFLDLVLRPLFISGKK